MVAAAAEQATNPADKQRFLDAGATSLIVAVKQDRTFLDSLYVFPELTTLRLHPTFLASIRTPRR